MNLARISELTNLINGWNSKLQKFRNRIENLQKEIVNTDSLQERLEYAAEAAKRRTEALSSLGVREGFLERIIQPVCQLPDCSGVGTVVKNEISDMEEKVRQTNDNIWWADQEKKRLETEDEVCPQ